MSAKNITTNADEMGNAKGFTFESAKMNPDGSFTISEEDAARVRAMAMNNNQGLTPEMQQAMGITNDYDQKVPDRVHNYICYDKASKDNEKFKEEANKFINEVIDDNATKDILDEAEATTKLSNFDFGDIGEYLNRLEELSFLEAVSYKKKVDSEIARWKSCQSMLKAISDLRLDPGANREIMKINAMKDYEFDNTIEDFESHYEENLDKLEKIAAKLLEVVNRSKDVMNSTKFLTDEMVHLMSGKLSKLDPNGLNFSFNQDKMKTVINAFQNRHDLEYMRNKFNLYLVTQKNNIKKAFKDDGPMIRNGRGTKVINDLRRFFSKDIFSNLDSTFLEIFEDNLDVCYLMMWMISKIMHNEKKSSNDTWAKVFVLNISDIANGIFDIDGITSEEYKKQIKDCFFESSVDFLKKNKLSLNVKL